MSGLSCWQRRKRWKALKEAAGNASLTDGLRVWRRFERINDVSFNWNDPTHRFLVAGHGETERFHRKMKRITWNRQEEA